MKTKVKIGTVVESDFGTGPVVAITKEWLIHLNQRGKEACCYLKDNDISIAADFSVPDVNKDAETEI
jgi:hypothetical protein